MAGALYNRYRPRTFGEVVGQGHVTAALGAALDNGRLHHAYLFSGPRGCGKTSSARILAASVNCEQGPTSRPCGTCAQCVGIRDGSSLDLIELDAASHGGVEDTRDLRERVDYAPVSARKKIYVIDEAHMVSSQGFNALLKVVEEPPAHVLFVFATTEPEKVLQTIRSRTFHYHFRLVPPRELTEHLGRICAQEGVAVADGVLPLVVRAGGGSVRDSLSVLDQLLSGAGSAGVTYADAAALLGLTDAVLLDRVVEALLSVDGAAVFGLVEEVVSAGHDPRRFAGDLLDRLRDLLVLSAAGPEAAAGALEHLPGSELDRLAQQARSWGLGSLSRAADLVHAGLAEMKGTTSPRLVLELTLAHVLLPDPSDAGAGLVTRLERLEAGLGSARPASPPAAPVPAPLAEPAPASAPRPTRRPEPPAPPAAAPAASPGPAEDPAPAAAPAAAAATAAAPGAGWDAVAVRERWPQILEAVRGRRRFTHALLEGHAQVIEVRVVKNQGDQGEVALAFRLAQMERRFSEGTLNAEVLAEALSDVLGGRFRVVVVPWPGGGAADGPSTGAAGPAGASPAGSGPSGAGPSGAVADRPAAATRAATVLAPAGAGDPGDPMDPAGPLEPDEPSASDAELPAATEDALLAELRSRLGAKVIGEIDA